MHTTMQTPRTEPYDPRPVYDGPEPELDAWIAEWEKVLAERDAIYEAANQAVTEARTRMVRAHTILNALCEVRNQLQKTDETVKAAY